jgi:hypothetical protein
VTPSRQRLSLCTRLINFRLLNDSVKAMFEPLQSGFRRVCYDESDEAIQNQSRSVFGQDEFGGAGPSRPVANRPDFGAPAAATQPRSMREEMRMMGELRTALRPHNVREEMRDVDDG